jgi:hypothetical protein
MCTIRELIEILSKYDPLTMTDVIPGNIRIEYGVQLGYNNYGDKLLLIPPNNYAPPWALMGNRIFDRDEKKFI